MDAYPKLGHYKILEKLGAGGMGEVYRAHDATLGRDVAIKVLAPQFARDPERLARFEREARVLASLNHPNIAAIYGFEQADGVPFLVLEYVPGETLKGPLPLDDALRLALQMAEAIEYAHEQGVIHRDLKPANVKVTPEGKLKVLDFGLAKALDDAPPAASSPNSPTISLAATRAGMILGTAGYMSPEQAKGRPADRRADIWAFGVVLYEMLTGKLLFSGDTVAETLALVMTRDPVIPESPPAIQQLLRRCLDRDPHTRLRDIGEARIVLAGPLSAESPASRVRPARPIAWIALAAVAALAALAAWTLKPAAGEPPLRKLEVAPGKVQPAFGSPISISPDGRRIAYVSGNRLWVRELDQIEPRQVDNSEGAIRPFWSPDSAFVAWAAAEKIWKAPAGGGQSVAVCVLPRAIGDSGGGAWPTGGRIIFSNGFSGFMEVSAQGGDPRPALELNPETELDFHHASPLPDGSGVLFVVHRKAGLDTLAVFSRQGRKQVLQLPGQRFTNPVYSPSGHVLYFRDDNNPGIWALPFSLAKIEATGEPFLAFPNANDPSVASDGTLAFVRGTPSRLTHFAWASRSGQVEGAIGEPQWHGSFLGLFLALSPDGRRLAVVIRDTLNNEVWVHDLARGARARLTAGFSPGWKHMPAWSPSGDRIAFVAGGSNSEYTVWLRAADGSGEPQKLVQGSSPEFSPDGKLLVYSAWKRPADWDLWYLPLEGDRKPVPIRQGSGLELLPRVSPDGRYLAYMSDESGRNEIVLTRFPSGEGQWQVSVNGGAWPHWNRSGDRLFYTEQDNSVMEVEVRTHPALSLGKPVKLFARKPSGYTGSFGWPDPFDVAPDGKRFVLPQPVGSGPDPVGITIVQNWFAEFRNKK